LLGVSDAVVIASSTDSHADHLIRAARAGIPAFCEKPLAVDLETTDLAIAEVERSGVAVQMGFNRRFDPGFAAARQVVRSGSLGTLLLVVGQHHDHRPPPAEYLPVSGGQFKDQLIHDFDLLRFVTGEEVVRVRAAGANLGMEPFVQHAEHVVSTVTLWLRSGAMAMLCGVRMDPIGYDVRMEFFGTGDSIAVGLDEQTPLRSVEPGQSPPEMPHREWLPRFGDSYRAEMDAFLDLAVRGGTSQCSVYDARAAFLIAEACGRSAASGDPIDLKEVTLT
jgi:myo-inositol 2-dehydrogenase/D-chiro-inositol 1-dehydrogenase